MSNVFFCNPWKHSEMLSLLSTLPYKSYHRIPLWWIGLIFLWCWVSHRGICLGDWVCPREICPGGWVCPGGGYPSLFYWQPSGSHYTYGRQAGSMYSIGMHSSHLLLFTLNDFTCDVLFGGGRIVAGRKTSLHNLMTDANIHYWKLLQWSIRTLENSKQ